MTKKKGPSRKSPPADPKPPGRKSTKTVVQRRIDEVLGIRLDGAQFHDIVRYASEKKWGVGERQLRQLDAILTPAVVPAQDVPPVDPRDAELARLRKEPKSAKAAG